MALKSIKYVYDLQACRPSAPMTTIGIFSSIGAAKAALVKIEADVKTRPMIAQIIRRPVFSKSADFFSAPRTSRNGMIILPPQTFRDDPEWKHTWEMACEEAKEAKPEKPRRSPMADLEKAVSEIGGTMSAEEVIDAVAGMEKAITETLGKGVSIEFAEDSHPIDIDEEDEKLETYRVVPVEHPHEPPKGKEEGPIIKRRKAIIDI